MKGPVHLIVGVIGISIGQWGCSPINLPSYTLLGDLRILTLIPSSPEVAPGSTVTFTPVLSDLNGQGRSLNYAVQGCLDPGVGIGATPVCSSPDLVNNLSGTVSLTAGTSNTFTGTVPGFSITTPTSANSLAPLSPAAQYNGVNYLVFYSVSVASGGPTVTSFVRITLSTKLTLNQNPTLSSVNLNDSSISSNLTTPTVLSHFSVTYAANSAETYAVMQTNGAMATQTETLSTTWFVSDGSFDFDLTVGSAENAWTPPGSKPIGRGSVILVVTKDGRNGASFQKIEMN